MQYKIGSRLLVSTPATETYGIKAAFDSVYVATEVKIIEYSLCGTYVKVELAESAQVTWWKVSEFPTFLAHLSQDDPQSGALSPLEELLLARRQLAYAEYCVTNNDSRIRAMAIVQMPIIEIAAHDLEVETGQVKVKLTPELQAFLKGEHFNRGLSDCKVLGIYPDIESP